MISPRLFLHPAAQIYRELIWRLYYLNPASVKAVVTIAYRDVHPRSQGFFSCITALKNKDRKAIFPELPSFGLFDENQDVQNEKGTEQANGGLFAVAKVLTPANRFGCEIESVHSARPVSRDIAEMVGHVRAWNETRRSIAGDVAECRFCNA